jgi:hypothetical protein
MYDASNRKQIREAEKAARRADLDRTEFIRAAMSTVQGRTWFFNFLQDCHVENQPPTFEPNRDYFMFGERNVGLRIKADILTHCPDQYIQMIKEADARDQLRDTRTEHAGSPDPGWDLEGRVESESDPDPDLGDAASIN